ncbi:MAG: 50S ribosomal protein L27 [Patescibacteria group bacterium]
MAHKKAAGTTKNGRDSNPKFLGIKLSDGSSCNTGCILVRQRGSNILPGNGVGMGRDYTLFALKDGKVKMASKRKVHFDGSTIVKKIATVV